MIRLFLTLAFVSCFLFGKAAQDYFNRESGGGHNFGNNSLFMKLLEIDKEGKIVLNRESIEKLKELNSPVRIVSSIGTARSGKSTTLNLILRSQRYFKNVTDKEGRKRELNEIKDEYKDNYGIWWTDMGSNTTGDIDKPKTLLFDMDPLVIGRNVNSSIKLLILGLLLSEKVLVNVMNDVDLVFVDYLRLLMSQTLQFSSLLVRRLSEYHLNDKDEKIDRFGANGDEIKTNIIHLIEKLYLTDFSWMIHSGSDYQQRNTKIVDSSSEYMDWLKTRIETYIWPETRGSHLHKNILDFIEKHRYYRIPMISRVLEFVRDDAYNYSDASSNVLPDRDEEMRLNREFENIGENIASLVLEDRNNNSRVQNNGRIEEDKPLTGRDIGHILEVFSETSHLFNLLKPLEIGNPNSKVITVGSLIENTIFIFGNKLENRMLNGNRHQPLLETEAEAIYNSTIGDMEHYWVSISEFDYFDRDVLNKNIKSHFERQYKQILERNCELIKSYCLKVINVHIANSIDEINKYSERLPVSKKYMSDFVDHLYHNTLSEIENSLSISEANSYKNSPCCKINKSGLLEKVQHSIQRLNERNQNEIEKIIQHNFKSSREALRNFIMADELQYRIGKDEFLSKIESLCDKARQIYNSQVELVGDSNLYSYYLARIEEEIADVMLTSGAMWDSHCKKNSFKLARSLAIKHNISIRSKLTLPVADKIIFSSFENLKKEATREMRELYCSDESSWINALAELESIIEEDMEQILGENLMSLKSLLHRPFQYSLQALMIANNANNYSWSVFVQEARKIAQELLDESGEFLSGSVSLDQSTRQKIIDIWIEQDLIKYKKDIIGTQVVYYSKYMFYLIIISLSSFILLYRGSLSMSFCSLYGFLFFFIIGFTSIFSLSFMVLPFISTETSDVNPGLSYYNRFMLKSTLIPKMIIRLYVRHKTLIQVFLVSFASLLLFISVSHYLKKRKALAPGKKDAFNSSKNCEVRTFVF